MTFDQIKSIVWNLQVLSFIFALDLVLFFTLSLDIDHFNVGRKNNLVKSLCGDKGK